MCVGERALEGRLRGVWRRLGGSLEAENAGRFWRSSGRDSEDGGRQRPRAFAWDQHVPVTHFDEGCSVDGGIVSFKTGRPDSGP